MAALPPLEGHIELGEELGRGAFGVVYQGHLADGRAVAVKLHGSLPPGEEARVHREAALLRDLRHPRLVAFHGLYQGPEAQLALVYELVRGVELEERLGAGALNLVETLAVAAGVAEGLDALHQVGLVHRDLKPGNIMLDAEGAPRLIDYGMLRPTEAGGTVTATGAVVGTPAYMAPEQITGGRPSPALDQYALGCVVFECLTGAPPYDGELSAILDGHLERPAPRLRDRAPHLPASLQGVLARMLSKRPEDRFGSCGQAIRELEEARRYVGAESQATEVVDGAAPTRALPSADPSALPQGAATAALAGAPTGVAAGEAPTASRGALVGRVAIGMVLLIGVVAGFLGTGSPPHAPPLEATPTPLAPSIHFPKPPEAPAQVTEIRFEATDEHEWQEWHSTDPSNGLYDPAIDRGHDVYIETLPVPVGARDLLATTGRGGVVLLRRGTLSPVASWRMAPIEMRVEDADVRMWFPPFLAPGPAGSAWLTASGPDAPPASLRLSPPLDTAGPVAASLEPTQGRAPWETVEVFAGLPRPDDPRQVRIESTADSYDGEAWVGNADTPGFSSWIRLRGQPPRPMSVLPAPVKDIPDIEAWRSELHVSGREIAMRPFRAGAGGGWVRGAAALIKPSRDLPAHRGEAATSFVAQLSGADGTVRGHAGYAYFQAEEPGTRDGPGRVHWRLTLAGYPEAFPYPYEGGFLMIHRGQLRHFPAAALRGDVPPEAGRSVATFASVCPEERYNYPTGTMTYDPRTGLDLLLWENLRYCHGRDEPQQITWLRYPDFALGPDGVARPGAPTTIARWILSLADAGVDTRLQRFVSADMTALDFSNLAKNPGFRRAQRLPGGRLWVVGLTSIDTANRILVLDLAAARVHATLKAGSVKALLAGPILYPGNEPGTWEVYFSDRGGRLFGGRLPRTRIEDG